MLNWLDKINMRIKGGCVKKYLKEIKGYIVVSLLLYTLEIITTSIMLFLPGYLVDNYDKGMGAINNLIVYYIVLFIIYLTICYFSNRMADYRRIAFERSIKKDFFNAVIGKNYEEYYEYDIGNYISMQANDITEMCQNYLSPMLSIFRSLIMIIAFGSALIYFVDFKIALTILAFSIIVVFVPNLTSKKLSRRRGEYLRSIGGYTSKVKLFLEGYDIFDSESSKKISDIHYGELNSVLSKNMNFRKLNSLAMIINGGSVELVSIVAFSVIAILLFSDEITSGMATTAFMYSTRFIDPMSELNLNIGRIKSIEEIKQKLNKIIKDNKTHNMGKVSSIKTISINNIKKNFGKTKIQIPTMSFEYPNKYLIVGDNGSGKSVLFKMIMGFYRPDKGEVLINGKREIGANSAINYVPQKPIIFDASYEDNITMYGTYKKDKLSYYESFFPISMINKIKENIERKNLSGGEKQVITILRALCSEKEVLLLDEPFAAMHKEVIDKFISNLNELDRLIIIIAHNIDEHMDKFSEVYTISSKFDASEERRII